jgi:outer membrane biosynthesis protein TonB
MYRLVFQTGRYRGKRLLVRRRITVVGSGETCHLRFPAAQGLAAEHVRLETQGNALLATPLAPGIPVLRNGAPIEGATRLAHGDVLSLGPVSFTYQSLLPPTRQSTARSRGLLQPATFLMLAAIFILQLAIMAFMVDWPRHLIPPAEYALFRPFAPAVPDDPEAAPADSPESAKSEEKPGKTAPPAPAPAVAPEKPEAPAEPEPEPPQPEPEPEPALSISLTPPGAAPVDPSIREALEKADFAPADTNATISLPPISAVDDATAEAQRRLAAAVSSAEFADYAAAQNALQQLHRTHPSFLPAYAEHARLLEKLNRTRDAVDMWGRLIAAAKPGDPLRAEAAAERKRLLALKSIRTASPSSAKAVPIPDGAIRIDAEAPRRMPADRDIEDMRILDFAIVAANRAKLPASGFLARLDVTFYDRDASGAISPSAAIVTPAHAVYTNLFAASAPKQISASASYVIPRGLRAREKSAGRGERTYYGYTLHLTGPAGRIVAAAARPKALLDRYPKPPPAVPAP